MQKLDVVGSVLYIAAHPDDENTRLIAWLGNGKKVRTGYLSLTRGDGGQNLIGPELGDALGVIRTEELLAARRIDGGEQYFTRAVDFGYSKSAEESFEKWGEQQLLGDVVRVIRLFRPEVIITRFPPTREAGHGHHEASAILAAEAFDLAGDPTAFPEQLGQGLQVWQPRRLFFNGSSWWRKDLAAFAQTDPDWYTVDVGGYDPLLGQSFTEIAGRSRSMHKSQGFGAAETRGELLEYLKFIKGERPKGKDLFDGIDMTWAPLAHGAAVQKAVDALLAGYDLRAPQNSVPALEKLAAAVDALPPTPWKTFTRARVDRLLLAVTGTVVEALANTPYAVTGDSVPVSLNILLRSPAPLWAAGPTGEPQALSPNETRSFPLNLEAPLTPDQPFWLERPHGYRYEIKDTQLIGHAVAPPQLQVPYTIRFANGTVVNGTTPVLYRTVDRVKGDLVQNCEVVPAMSFHANPGLLIVTDTVAHVWIVAEAFTDVAHADLTCEIMADWDLVPQRSAFGAMKAGEVKSVPIQVKPGANAGRNGPYMRLNAGHAGPANLTRHVVRYDHIPVRSWYTPATFRIEPVDVEVDAGRIGYIMGAGDQVPQAMAQLGLKVDLLDPATATARSLAGHDAIVIGIRAYNTTQGLKRLNPLLMDYVRQGGTVVAQYTTRSNDMVLPDSLIGPYPFRISRERVTVEEAPATLLAPEHPLLNKPNKITAADFEGWVQERGLYFLDHLDPHYTPLIAWNDPGEAPLDGALVACNYGKGRYIYTGISFFRQLPAGVPGAYRLFANLISQRR
ncbi:MAG: PIG-L family deacetylase [Flavobacteriales bacterium]|nr:PIG-L family deacetylase [Flavobacteriales bacterium]MBP9081091.1 PIG-L family deacetylase [Flavobacteriales bacterium]